MSGGDKRRGPLRNTFDDGMTFAELIGVPNLSETAAAQIFTAGISTHEGVEAYRQEQLKKLEARDRNKRNATLPRNTRHRLRPKCEALIKQVCLRNTTLTANAVAVRVLGKLNPDDTPFPTQRAVADWARQLFPDRFKKRVGT